MNIPDENQPIDQRHPGSAVPCVSCGTRLSVAALDPLDPIICPECKMEQVVPVVVGGYKLIRRLGEGAMGRVYLGEDPNLQRAVAVKLLRADFTSSPSMWTLLEKEARAAATIAHHNVVHVYDFGKICGRPYIVMELVESGSLENRLRAKNLLSEAEAIQVGIDAMRGLRAANRAELLHGDIKPANIILAREGQAKIADFGLARFHEDRTVVERWGTPFYIAPEKSQCVQEDFRSDLYSLGATLFHVVSGYPPFNGDTAEDVIEKSLHAKTPRLRDRFPDASPGFSEIVYTMMRREPDDRFWSYDKAIACLEQLQKGAYRPGNASIRGGKESIWQQVSRRVSIFLNG